MKTISLFGKGAVSGYILFVLMTLCSMASAQQPPNSNQSSTITGTVSDETGVVMDASVSIKNSDIRTFTDENGFYSISALSSDVLVFAFPGYNSVEVPVGDKLVIDVVLSGSVALDEAVINAGYYTVKDRERTGSISRVTAEEIENQPVNNVLEALQGRVSGLDIVQNTGLAGGGYTVRIRGQNSIAAGNEPLYIIDGVPYDVGSLGNPSLGMGVLPGGNVNPLNTFDPSSIESIEVLKDADATAIYGSRGANGVLLITTKKGKSGKTSVSVEASTTLISVTKMMDLLNTEQYLAMRGQAFANDGITEYPAYAYDINGTWDQNRYTDWQKEFIGNTAYNHTVRTMVSGGNEKTRFAIGGSFMKETTVFPMDFNYKKTSVFANVNHHSSDDRFKIQFSANYGQDKNSLPTQDLIRTAKFLAPNAPAIYDDQGNLNWENSSWNNPYASLESTYRNTTQNLMANAVVSYKFLEILEFKTNLGYNRSDLNELQTNPHTMYNPAYGLTSASSTALKNDGNRNSWIIEPQLDASYDIGEGELSMTLGATFQEQNTSMMGLYATGFVNNQQITHFSSAQNLEILNETSAQYRYLAAYARINYNWMGKYILNLTGRRDGSSRFGDGNRFANFGAVGAAWIFSKENALADSSWLSFGKLRASYGTTGNDQIGDYQYLNTYQVTDASYDGNIGIYPSRLYNPNFGWEKNRKIEAALEASLWKNRLQFEISYYNNRSGNQLLGIPLPGTTGFSSINANLNATVENSGWEMSFQSTNIKNKDFQWDTSIQLTLPKNKLIHFENLENSTYSNQLVIGHSLSIYKLYQLNGIDTETGLYDFVDYNGDGELTPSEDREFIADVSPEFYGSLSNSLRYRNWNIDILFQFVKKDGLNEFFNTEPSGFMQNQSESVLNEWSQNNPSGNIQSYTSGNNFDAYYSHTRFTQSNAVISDASFIRLKNLSISYKLPLNKESNTSCTLTAQGQNLITLTKFKGGDPEQTPGFLPPMKRISFGVRVEF